MISINLVPEELIKKKKYQFVRKIVKSMPPEILIGAIGGSLALLLAVNVLLQLVIFVQFANVQRLQISLDLMVPEKRQVDQVLSNLKVLRQKINVIENVTTGKRISWAQKLNIVSDLILPGLWLDRIALDKDFFFVGGKAVSAKGDQFMAVSNFNTALRNNPIFMKGLKSAELVLGERRREKTLEVGDFVIKATLNPASYE
jgi:Tfp pilus assembly protein PilN